MKSIRLFLIPSFCIIFYLTGCHPKVRQIQVPPSPDLEVSVKPSEPKPEIPASPQKLSRADYLNAWAIDATGTQQLLNDPEFPSLQKKIIIAVIDTGVDIEHPELKEHIWTDTVTQIHGWNFLGNKNGNNLIDTNLEVAREVKRLNLISQKRLLTQDELEYHNLVKKKLNQAIAENQLLNKITKQDLETFRTARTFLLEKTGIDPKTKEDLQNIINTHPELAEWTQKLSPYINRKINISILEAWLATTEKMTEVTLNPDFEMSQIIGDDPADLKDTHYGNEDLLGGDGVHGTHVAGIIVRQFPEALIMPLRVVPKGDERDKDVANAIFFAVDHGAHIINLSLSKEFSSDPQRVEESLLYAEKHNVLVVHSAGNYGLNLDSENQYFPKPKNHLGERYSNWLEVGASTSSDTEKFVSVFSNYGQNTVDLFAPGEKIISLAPKGGFALMSGTSMAAPQVTGIAGLLWSRYPTLSANQLKELIIQSVRRYPELQIIPPRPMSGMMSQSPKLVSFCRLSISCGVIDAHRAFLDLKKINATKDGIPLATKVLYPAILF